MRKIFLILTCVILMLLASNELVLSNSPMTQTHLPSTTNNLTFTFYEHINEGGAEKTNFVKFLEKERCYYLDDKNSLACFKKGISSIRYNLSGRYALILFTDECKGFPIILYGEGKIMDLDKDEFNVNDKITSFRLIEIDPTVQGTINFYEHENYLGRRLSIQLNLIEALELGDCISLKSGLFQMHDQISSMQLNLPNAMFVLFSDDNCTNTNLMIPPGENKFPRLEDEKYQFSDVASSFKLLK